LKIGVWRRERIKNKVYMRPEGLSIEIASEAHLGLLFRGSSSGHKERREVDLVREKFEKIRKKREKRAKKSNFRHFFFPIPKNRANMALLKD